MGRVVGSKGRVTSSRRIRGGDRTQRMRAEVMTRLREAE